MSLYFFGSSGYIHAKAVLAQYLIKDAWQHTLQNGQQTPPWAWADTFPVATLDINGERLYVLSGATGRTLAFAPGHLQSTPLPGEQGNSVITGHRDTHFSVLASVQVNDVIAAQTTEGVSYYNVVSTRIVDESNVSVIQNTSQGTLTLITCYPFNGLMPNTHLRWVVSAKRMP
ncbi:class GN sortase [Alteromonas sediminis]|uniref:Class GN sortase n=2 Tax=Alteromonas sediminis TaxID=2259342 RepID=A0A3N5ZEI7_9ALTE|nr:class GN sortase [Alteromonas sediminis]